MVSSAILLLVFVAGLQLDLTSSYPKITHDPKQKPSGSFNRFTYKAEKEVRLSCSDGVKWGPIKIEKGNPVFKDAKVTKKPWVGVKKTDLGLILQYDVTHFVNQVKVICKGSGYLDDDVTIVQNYRTTNVKILSVNQSVEGGQRVTLKCVADGNPDPTYQWYNKTKTGFEKVNYGNFAKLDLTTPKDFNTASLYQCRARNELNKAGDWINSTSLQSVNSTGFPDPKIEADTKPIAIETNPAKFTYKEAEKVTVKCSLPDYVVKGVKLAMNFKQMTPDKPSLIKISPKGSEHNLALEISYNKSHFARLVSVSCQAESPSGLVVRSSEIQIEQKYGVQSVAIDSPSSKEVEPGDRVVLICNADSNPAPQLYQWYNNSHAMADAKKDTLKFEVPYKFSTKAEYFCRAKNEYNNDYKQSNSVTVFSRYIVPPIMALISPTPIQNTSSLYAYVYEEEEKITIYCTLPASIPNDIKLGMTAYQTKPVYPNLIKSSSKEIDRNNITMEIIYNKLHFARLVVVICRTEDAANKTKSSDLIRIEQKYGVQNVAVDGPKEVEPGTKVVLTCTADANPDPQYRWYINSNPIDKANGISYEFMVPDNHVFEGEYSCGAKNEYDNGYKKSKPFKVSSMYVPTPTITPVTPFKTKESTKITYEKAPTVTVSCSLPKPVPANIELETKIKQIMPEGRNLFTFSYIQKPTDRDIQLVIEYYPLQFARLLTVSCIAKNKAGHVNSSSIAIEQRYGVQMIEIDGSQYQRNVKAGDVVKLRCLVDSNPDPEYQWYNNSKEIKDANKDTLQFTTPDKWSTKGNYACGAKNEYDKEFKKSIPITVSAVKRGTIGPPTPTPTPGSAATYSSSWALTLAAISMILVYRAL